MNEHQRTPERYLLFSDINKFFVWMEGSQGGRSPSWCDAVHDFFVFRGDRITVRPILVVGSCGIYVISECGLGIIMGNPGVSQGNPYPYPQKQDP